MINLNGTSREALLEQQCNAISYLRKAIQMLQQAAPNGRDYTPQGTPEGTAAYGRAAAEHRDRLDRLQSVMSELETIGEHLA